MKYVMEMAPEDLIALNEALRLTPEEFENAVNIERIGSIPARRILRARRILGFSNTCEIVEGVHVGPAILPLEQPLSKLK